LSEAADAYESLMQFLYRAPIGLVQTTLVGQIEMINPMSASLLMPLSRDGNLDNLFTALQDVAPTLRQMTAALQSSSGIVCESLRFSLPAGPGAGVDDPAQIVSLSLLKLDENRLMGVLLDATLEAKREQDGLLRKLGAAARFDKLTQLPNRVVVTERLQLAIERKPADAGYEFALLYLNCDRFKQINDAFGHAVGDELLSLLAGRLRSTLRGRERGGDPRGDAPMAARIGGDEFIVLLDDLLRSEDVYAVAQRLISVLSKPYAIGARQVYCGVSMGIVMRGAMAGDADAVLQDASLAMAEAKQAGGGRCALFEPAMHLRATARAGIEADLRSALSHNQLFVVYQPVVGLQGDRAHDGGFDRSVGVEALVRWLHPERGVVGPVEFIGVAEETGLIDELGEMVLTTACHDFMRWQEKLGPRAPHLLAVNLSRRQLEQPGLVATVHGILRASRMPPAQLQLEVTESLAAKGEAAQTRLQELKALGLTLALDDFGTGYSSLSSLHQIPVDTVKIDQSFVRQAATSLHHRVLIDATIRVAHSLGMTTVAEGIETQAQATVIQQLGSDKGQGYLYSKPLPSDQLVRWLTSDEHSKAVA
jgi:diguanylate cyclase (GGDEF)-like protein